MQRELLILRHGKSDWETGNDDFYRPLKTRGKRGAQRIGAWLQENDLLPDYLVSSPATRAIETARKASKSMGLTADAVHQDPRLYEAGTQDILQVLADCPSDARRVLLVGHNPGLADVIEWLADTSADQADDGNLLPTATLAHLQTDQPWDGLQPSGATLLAITRAKDLAKGFPFPTNHGVARRDRPDYYYTQSSVIPYRLNNGLLEILIVASSSAHHWVVPKGIHEPGMSAQGSAAREAREEAGVEGTVEEPALGAYRYEKWGAECTVEVYAMRVTRVIPESEWEESQRGRLWVPVAQAAERLKQKALVPMLHALEAGLT